jgi:hypothetical protein
MWIGTWTKQQRSARMFRLTCQIPSLATTYASRRQDRLLSELKKVLLDSFNAKRREMHGVTISIKFDKPSAM